MRKDSVSYYKVNDVGKEAWARPLLLALKVQCQHLTQNHWDGERKKNWGMLRWGNGGHRCWRGRGGWRVERLFLDRRESDQFVDQEEGARGSWVGKYKSRRIQIFGPGGNRRGRGWIHLSHSHWVVREYQEAKESLICEAHVESPWLSPNRKWDLWWEWEKSVVMRKSDKNHCLKWERKLASDQKT